MADLWPSSLPSCFILGSHSESMGDGLLRSSMDMGPAKIRRRSSFIPKSLSGSLQMSADQVRILQSFVNVTLLGGSLPFSMKSQDGNARILARFATLPSWERVSGNRFRVQVALEVLDSLPALAPVFATTAMPMGRENVAYSWTPSVIEGSRPLRSFAIVSGSLPSGLRLNSATGEVTGSANVFGTYAFTIQVTDAIGRTAVLARSVFIRPPYFVFHNGAPIDARVTRGGLGSFYDRFGQMQTSAPNLPRFDYDPNTAAFRGVLVEQWASNSWPNASTGTGWVAGGSTPPAILNAQYGLGHRMVAIDLTASSQPGFNGTHARLGVTALVPAGVTHTHSIYVTLSRPLVNDEALFYYATGNNAAPGIALDKTNTGSMVGKWERIVPAPFTPTFDSNVYPAILPRTAMLSPITVFVSYWQIEPGNVATTPILTEGGANGRDADTISFDLPSPRNSILYTFDDGSTRTLTHDGYTHTIPFSLPRKRIRRIEARTVQ